MSERHQFTKDTGIKLDDLIAEAVQHAEIVLEQTKKYDSRDAAPHEGESK